MYISKISSIENYRNLSGLTLKFEEELSIFYVAITRAKRDVFLFANSEANYYGHKKMSCLAMLPNLTRNMEF